MNETVIDTLASLQEIDRRNRERELEISALDQEESELRSTIDSKRSIVDAQRADSQGTLVRRRELEALLQEEERKIKDRRMRLSRIRNETELMAAEREIEANKEANSRLEEELLTLMEQGESADGGLQELEEELTTLEGQLKELEKRAKGRRTKLRAEVESEKDHREEVAGQLQSSIRKKYERIFKHREGIAVVHIVGGNACGGCNMNVPPQLCIEVQKGEKIHLCPSCNRILYWAKEAPAEAEAEAAE